MTPPDEVLRKMAEAAGYAEFIMCDAATCNGMCEAPEVHFAPAIQRALTAAAECGWVLVPREADETMERLQDAVGELERAWSFHDRVVASSPDERSAVGQDHHEWCERAARNAIRALQP